MTGITHDTISMSRYSTISFTHLTINLYLEKTYFHALKTLSVSQTYIKDKYNNYTYETHYQKRSDTLH